MKSWDNAAKFTYKVLDMAEKEGLTVEELYISSKQIKNHIINEQMKEKYKREKPRE